MKKKIAIVIAVAAVLIIATVLIFTYQSSAYTGYEKAYDKLFKTGSMEFNLTSTVTMDGKEMQASGNMKTKNENGLVLFLYTLNFDDKTVTMFSDGDYVYTDTDGQKTKMKIGDKLQATEKGEFDMDLLQQELVNMIDANRIQELQLFEKVKENKATTFTKEDTDNGTTYEIEFSKKVAEKVLQTMVNDEMDESMGAGVAKPEFTLNSMKYIVNTNSDGYLSGMNYDVDCNLKLPAALTKEASDKDVAVQVVLNVEVVNPGTKVDFTLPDTSGYDMKTEREQ